MKEFSIFLAAIFFGFIAPLLAQSENARFGVLVFLILYNSATLREEIRIKK